METQKKFSQSVGAGMKSVFGSSGRNYFVIEHKTDSKNFAAGDRKEIIIDQIALGRDKKCQISFGNEFSTVSRHHAIISKQDNNWVIRHKGTNPTLVNGRPVAKEWYLQNGDEIQLSYEGPKMGFILPNNPSVKSINLSRRLSLFRQQALRPYKQAITAVSLIFLFAIVGLTYFLVQTIDEHQRLADENRELQARAESFSGDVDSLEREITQSKEAQRRVEAELRSIKERVEEVTMHGTTGNTPPPAMDEMFPSVYFIIMDKLVLEFSGEYEEITDYSWSGTGFLLNDKRFITARHVIEPWYYFEDETSLAINLIASNGGKVTAYYKAYSPDGSMISFTNKEFKKNRDNDEIHSTVDDEGNPIMLRVADIVGGDDWASLETDKEGLISYSNELSNSLAQQTGLHILGFPRGLGASDLENIEPIYGSCVVGSSGLNEYNAITVSNRNFTNGNSGGPVFALRDNEYVAIGVVSAGADNLGFVVPISATQ